MAQQITPEGSRYGIDVGTRWRDGTGSRTVIVLWVQRSGVVVYRHEGAALEDERVTNVIRFVETFVPADGSADRHPFDRSSNGRSPNGQSPDAAPEPQA